VTDRPATLDQTARPRLMRGVRLREDPARGFILLAPERVLTANPTAVEVLKRCDGERTVTQIVDELAVTFSADRARVAVDVEALLADLATKRMVAL
jgi:pyrroloquinoline quinone biosynthesis protein D